MVDKGVDFEDAVNEFEKRFIGLVLKKVNGNQSKAAELLGIHRNTLGRKLGQLGLDDRHARPRRFARLGRKARRASR